MLTDQREVFYRSAALNVSCGTSIFGRFELTCGKYKFLCFICIISWVLNKREEQRLETAQMKFLRHLLGITKLDKEKNQRIRGKNRSTEHSKGNKIVPEKVATTRTEDGQK